MAVAWRAGCADDLSGCLVLLQGRSAYDAATLQRLPAVWRHLFYDTAVRWAVVEDLTLQPDRRLLAFGASVFVSDAWMVRERLGAQPFVTSRTIQRNSMDLPPILRARVIGAAQAAEGVNLLNLHYAEVTGGRLDVAGQNQCAS